MSRRGKELAAAWLHKQHFDILVKIFRVLGTLAMLTFRTQDSHLWE